MPEYSVYDDSFQQQQKRQRVCVRDGKKLNRNCKFNSHTHIINIIIRIRIIRITIYDSDDITYTKRNTDTHTHEQIKNIFTIFFLQIQPENISIEN